MLLPITNTPRDYAWGSTTAIPELFGVEPTGEPQAELWFGTHPGSPARIVGSSAPAPAASSAPAASPASPAASSPSLIDELGGEPLPFLLKILAAGSPLSLQAHPTSEQAREGFDRENAAGIALDDPARNYRDPSHKPELIVALSDAFDALCGFRPVPKTKEILAVLGSAASPLADRLAGDFSLEPVFTWLLGGSAEVATLVADVSARARELATPSFSDDIGTVVALADAYPGDPGILVSLLLNRVTLSRGEALYLPAGNIHAYLGGTGVELMAASDNVLRGGLTRKHLDVPELLRVLDFRPGPPPRLQPTEVAFGVEVFAPEVPDFRLFHAVTDAELAFAAPTIAVCTGGSFTVNGMTLAPGGALFATPDESPLVVTGDGDLWIATSTIAPV